MSVTGELLTLVGVQEMDEDVIYALDLSSMKFFTNGGFKKRTGPNGNQYFEVRATTGYSYLVDVCCFGDLIVHKPGVNGVMYGISY